LLSLFVKLKGVYCRSPFFDSTYRHEFRRPGKALFYPVGEAVLRVWLLLPKAVPITLN